MTKYMFIQVVSYRLPLENSSPVKIYKVLIRDAKKHVGPTKDYPHLTNFANDAFRLLLEKLGGRK